jgi:hypothetical protein
MHDPAGIADHLNTHPLLLAGIIAFYDESLRKQGVVQMVKPSEIINQVISGEITLSIDVFDEKTMNASERTIYKLAISMISDGVDQHFIRIDEDSINLFITKYFLEPLERDENPYDYDAVPRWHIDNGVLYVTSVVLLRSVELN